VTDDETRSDVTGESRRAATILASFLQDLGADTAAFEALCRRNPRLDAELREAFADWKAVRALLADPTKSIDSLGKLVELLRSRRPQSGADPAVMGAAIAGLNELEARLRRSDRYRKRERIAKGGMGVVSRAWDEELRRFVAMKTLSGSEERDGSVWHQRFARFVEEAQVTGQLDHPGIVPVHELGVDEDGRVFFTMKLVRGETLAKVIDHVHRREAGWSLTLVLRHLLRLCEAMAYAHAKGVLHRDLKPTNVMIGRFGEVYVMDWGLARTLSSEPPDSEGGREVSVVSSIRSGHDSGSSPLVTEHGSVLGTPAYMSPEQASGDPEQLGPHSDVYSLGAILYHVLSGQAPYVGKDTTAPAEQIWERVRKGPPKPLRPIAPDAPEELVAICDKAMARTVDDRYADFEEVARELAAYLDGRVVQAHRRGPLIELRKWIGRNRASAAAFAIALVVVLFGSLGVAWSEARRAETAREGERQVRAFLDGEIAANLVARVDELWPVHPATVPRLQAWRAELEALLERTSERRRRIAELVVRAEPGPDPAELLDGKPEWRLLRARLHGLRAVADRYDEQLISGEGTAAELERAEEALRIIEPELRVLAERLAAAERAVERARPLAFAAEADREDWERHASFARSVATLVDERDGLRRVVGERLETARSLESRSLGEHSKAWDAALRSIADEAQSPLYHGLSLSPQLGLVPLGRDDSSGLWEFWHVLSGERPERDRDGRLVLRAETGLVFVLLPGGETRFGAQAQDPRAPHYDPRAASSEGPVRTVQLAPFFLSKYEMTIAQWARLTEAWPNAYYVGFSRKGSPRISPTNPVEHVAWVDARERLARWGLTLPTEAQWEYAARGGSTAPYWFGATLEPFQGHVNSRRGADTTRHVPGPDGYIVHGPVDLLEPNPYGFFGILGNVAEWCLDWHGAMLDAPIRPGTGELIPEVASTMSCRGGSFWFDPFDMRSSSRFRHRMDYRSPEIGVRPALAVQ